MTAIAVAELTVAAPLSVAFARFIDFAHWDLWMPESFRPVVGPARSLQLGDKFKVSVRPRLPALALEVVRVRPEKEICWRGGRAPFLQVEHSYLFARDGEDGQRTRIRSEEPFSGFLTRGPLALRLEQAATVTAREVLSRFDAYLQRVS